MEHGEGGNEKKQLEAEVVSSEVKKQWKNPSQVQILEDAYAVAPNPSAAMKEELAKLTGLDYKQVQYWFGNRRYMDRHGPRRYRSRNEGDGRYVNLAAVSSPAFSSSSMSIAELMNGIESLTSRRNSEMLKPLVPAGPAVMQAEIATQKQPELQVVVKHIEKKLGHPLKADGPILGIEFKPLPPGAFGAPLANATQWTASLWPCNGRVTERPKVVSIKAAAPSPILEHCSVTNLSSEGALVARGVDSLDPDGSLKAVQEYQFFPMQPTWLESHEKVKQAHCPFSSVNTSNYECACAASSLPFQEQLLNATDQSQQERQMTISSALNNCQKSPNLLCTNSASDPQYGNHPDIRVENPFLSSDNTITCDANARRREKIHPSGSSSGNDKHQLHYTEVQKIVDSKKEMEWGILDVGHGDHGQGDHGQGGQNACDLQRGLRENQTSIVLAFKEVVNESHNEAIMNQTRSGLPDRVGHRHGYSRYFVRPRERSRNSIIVADDTRMSYFRDIGSCARPLIAEWNERENRAIYIVDDNESELSWSIESDSTCSDGFDDEATANGKHYAQTKPVDLYGVDAKEDDVGVDREGQEFMDVDQNVEDDEDETDDEDYKDMEEVTRDNNVEVDEYRKASPLSSEKTA